MKTTSILLSAILLWGPAALADTRYAKLAEPTPTPRHDFAGTVSSGTEFQIPACPTGSQPVVMPILPLIPAPADGEEEGAVFFQATSSKTGVVHVQVRWLNGPNPGPWQELPGITVQYDIDCHPRVESIKEKTGPTTATRQQ